MSNLVIYYPSLQLLQNLYLNFSWSAALCYLALFHWKPEIIQPYRCILFLKGRHELKETIVKLPQFLWLIYSITEQQQQKKIISCKALWSHLIYLPWYLIISLPDDRNFNRKKPEDRVCHNSPNLTWFLVSALYTDW